MSGIRLSRPQVIIILVVFVVIVVAVGLMAGLLPNRGGTKEEATPTTSAPTDLPPTGASTTPDYEAYPWLYPLLPEHIHPSHYAMWLYPDFYFDRATFHGSSSISISSTKDINHILVHIKLMTITLTKLETSGGVDIELGTPFAHEENQYWVVPLKDTLPANTPVVLQLDFNGLLNTSIVGYYKSTYYNSLTGKDSWLATSKFQPSDARKAFPCFDEPRFKATYTITLRHWSNFTALSNMPPQTTTTVDSVFSETSFQQSPPMSTYLVCFIVNDFSYRENTLVNSNNITHRVYAPPDKVDDVTYALEKGQAILNYFADEFDMKFHLPKFDHFAVPDYPSGATEHWGLTTYREGRVLFNDSLHSASDKQGVMGIVSHEIVHAWFGNPVTCLWWDDLWLNEGFATYYAVYGGDAADNLEMVRQFLPGTQQTIMSSDAGASPRPLIIDIKTPNDANAAFDGITYRKGASMLRMLNGFMGHTTFRQAIRSYLKTHEFGSAVTQDLLDALDSVSPTKNITKVMGPWLYQGGLPVVEIISGSGTDITAKQSRLINDPAGDISSPASPYGYKWYIPLNYKTEGGVTGQSWMDMEDITFPDPRASDTEWVMFNPEQTGYFRVKYPDDIFQKLVTQLTSNHQVLTPSDRCSLLDDALSLARAGLLSYNNALDMTQYLFDELEYDSWTSARNAFNYISTMFFGISDFSKWKRHVETVVAPAMNHLKVANDGTHLETRNRQKNIIPLACGHGNVECLQNTSRLFLFWVTNDTLSPVPINIRREVYAYGMEAEGDDDNFDVLWQRYTDSHSVVERSNIVYALSRARSPWLIHRLLEYCMDPEKIKDQDFFTVVQYAASNMYTKHTVWDWVRDNYQAIIDRFTIQSRYLGTLVPNIVRNFNTKVKLDEVEDFFVRYPDPGTGEYARASALDTIRTNIAWMERSRTPIVDWLKVNYP